MLSLLGRLAVITAGAMYALLGYSTLPGLPLADVARGFFAEGVLSAGVILVGAVCGYIATNFLWNQSGFLTKVVSITAVIPLAAGFLVAVSEGVGRLASDDAVRPIIGTVFLVSGIVLLASNFFLSDKKANTAEHSGH